MQVTTRTVDDILTIKTLPPDPNICTRMVLMVKSESYPGPRQDMSKSRTDSSVAELKRNDCIDIVWRRDITMCLRFDRGDCAMPDGDHNADIVISSSYTLPFWNLFC